jgi:hypothetical protein
MEARVGTAPAENDRSIGSSQTLLLAKRREMHESAMAMEQAKEQFRATQTALAGRQELLQQKDAAFHENMLAVSSTLQENDAKRERAIRRAAEEAAAIRAKERELEEGAADEAASAGELAVLTAAKRKLQRYRDFMAAYQGQHSEEFHEISLVLERYATLGEAEADLMREAGRLQGELEVKRTALSRVSKARATASLNAENQVAYLRERIEIARAEVLALSAGEEAATARFGSRTRELGSVLQSVANLHVRCVKGPRGGVIRHNPADAEVLGRPIPDLYVELGMSVHLEDEGTSLGGDEDVMALLGPGMEGEEWLDEVVSSSKANNVAAALARTGKGATRSVRPTVIIAAASPRKKVADGVLPGEGSPGSPVKGGKAQEEDMTGMEPALVRAKARAALGNLYVVGACIVDLAAIVAEYPAWAAERNRANAAVEDAAAVAAEKARAELAAAARKANPGGIASPVKSAVGKAGGVQVSRGDDLVRASGAAGTLAASKAGPGNIGATAVRGGGGSNGGVPSLWMSTAPVSGEFAGTGERVASLLAKRGLKVFAPAATVAAKLLPPSTGVSGDGKAGTARKV